MNRVWSVILAFGLLLGYGSGALRAVHELSHEHSHEHSQWGGSERIGERTAHPCGGSSCPGATRATRGHGHGHSHHDVTASDHGAIPDGNAASETNQRPVEHHDCSVCEFLATSAPIDLSPTIVLALAGRMVDTAALSDELAPKQLAGSAGDVRGPPRR